MWRGKGRDLAMVWQTAVAEIVERNPAFADLWYWKLENDPLELDPAAALVAA